MDPVTMEDCFDVSDAEKEDDEEEATAHLRDRFRISTISIAESEAKRNNLEISQSVIVCISDLAFKYAETALECCSISGAGYSSAVDIGVRFSDYVRFKKAQRTPRHLGLKSSEQLADDLELFAHHANRKIVNMNDVILSAHRNKHLADTLRAFSHDLKAKEPHSEKKRKKSSNKEDKGFPSVHHIDP